MGALAIVLLILAALVVAGLTFIVIQFKTFQRGHHYNKTFSVDDEEVKVKTHFAFSRRNGEPPRPPMLLRWLKKYGFAMLGHIWIWMTYETASRKVVAHELTHRAQQHIIGGVRYVLMSFGQWATQWKHDRRGMEEEANRGEEALAATGTGWVVIAGKRRLLKIPWLMELRQ